MIHVKAYQLTAADFISAQAGTPIADHLRTKLGSSTNDGDRQKAAKELAGWYWSTDEKGSESLSGRGPYKHKEVAQACGVEESNWAAIPLYKLGDTPEHLAETNPIDYRLTIAKRALAAGYEDIDVAPSQLIVDMLGDLRHLSDRLGYNFATLDRQAYGNYRNETATNSGNDAALPSGPQITANSASRS